MVLPQTSASLNPGDAGSPNTPQVEDWNDGGSLVKILTCN